jgi:hypothetical protein
MHKVCARSLANVRECACACLSYGKKPKQKAKNARTTTVRRQLDDKSNSSIRSGRQRREVPEWRRRRSCRPPASVPTGQRCRCTGRRWQRPAHVFQMRPSMCLEDLCLLSLSLSLPVSLARSLSRSLALSLSHSGPQPCPPPLNVFRSFGSSFTRAGTSLPLEMP